MGSKSGVGQGVGSAFGSRAWGGIRVRLWCSQWLRAPAKGHGPAVYREAEVDEDPDVIVTREVELAEAVVRENLAVSKRDM